MYLRIGKDTPQAFLILAVANDSRLCQQLQVCSFYWYLDQHPLTKPSVGYAFINFIDVSIRDSISICFANTTIADPHHQRM